MVYFYYKYMDLTPTQKAINRSRNILIASCIIYAFVVGAIILTILGLLNCEELGCLLALVPGFFAVQGMFLAAPIMLIIIRIRIKRNKKLDLLAPEDQQKISSKNKVLKIFFAVFIVLFLGSLYLPVRNYVNQRLEISNDKKERREAKERLEERRQLEKLSQDRLKFLAEDLKKPHKIVSFIDMGEVNFHGPYTQQIGVFLDNNIQIALIATETKEQESDFLKKLNSSDLIGTEIFVEDIGTITALPDYYSCKDPDFSKNTCGKEILFAGADLRFYSNKKEFARYIYCYLNFFPFSSSAGWSNEQYCAEQ